MLRRAIGIGSSLIFATTCVGVSEPYASADDGPDCESLQPHEERPPECWPANRELSGALE